MVVNQKDYVLSEWNEDLKYYINTWYGFVGQEDFIDGVKIGQAFMIKNKVKYHLADTTNMTGAWDGGDWIVDNFWKSVVEGGLTHFGLIIPEDNFYSSLSSDVMLWEMQKKGVALKEYKVFISKADAENWIRECQKNEA